MNANEAGAKDFRSQWAAASLSRKLATALVIVLVVAIVVFAIVPLTRTAFNLGQQAVR